MGERLPTPSVWDWGKDHWSTFAYLECRTVDQEGRINNDHMRCNPRRHSALFHGLTKAARRFSGGPRSVCPDGSFGHPTRLKEGEIPEHDDWDCVDDMIDVGLVRVLRDELDLTRRAIWGPFSGTTITVALTELGQKVAAQLREHKANGGNFRDFVPGEQTLKDVS